MFVDRAKIIIGGGKGGNGAVSFRREPFVPEGGPDGGDGGRGGNVVFLGDRNLRTLMDFRYKKKYLAENGENGGRKKCFGKQGKDLIIKVPLGTMIFDAATGFLMYDIQKDGESFIAAYGGKGGKGNVHFKNSVRQAPNFAEAGEDGTGREVILELKLIADAGLVGFPNVGKSSILAASTNAKPKIDNYHFTTIDPNIGIVEIPGSEFALADIAGIIEGAHKGIGLGLRFLKHIERTRVLIHVVDVSGSEGRDPKADFDQVMEELESYGHNISEKPMIVAANKIDLINTDESEIYINFSSYIKAKGLEIYPVSAATGKGIKELMYAIAEKLQELGDSEDDEDKWTLFDFDSDDKTEDYRKVHIEKDGDVFVLSGKQLKKIFDSTNFNDMGSLRYLYKYIEKSGAVNEMKEMGLKEGDTVRLFDLEFEFYDE